MDDYQLVNPYACDIKFSQIVKPNDELLSKRMRNCIIGDKFQVIIINKLLESLMTSSSQFFTVNQPKMSQISATDSNRKQKSQRCVEMAMRLGNKRNTGSLSYLKIKSIKKPPISPNDSNNADSNFSGDTLSLRLGPTVTHATSLEAISLQGIFYFMARALNQCHSIHQNYGYSNFEVQKCEISEKGKLILNLSMLIDEANGSKSETAIVARVIEAAKTVCGDPKFQDFYFFYRRVQTKHVCDFKYTLSLLKSYCACSKIQVVNFMQRFIPKAENNLEVPITLHAQSRATSNLRVPSTQKSRKRRQSDNITQSIPNFLKLSKSQQKQKKGANQSNSAFNKNMCFSLKNLSKSNRKPMRTPLIGKGIHSLVSIQNSSPYNIKQSQTTGDCTQSYTFNMKNNSQLSSPDTSCMQGVVKESSTSLFSKLPLVPESESKLECSKVTESRIQERGDPCLDQIFYNNNWVKTIEKLSCTKNPVVESFIDGKDDQSKLTGFNPEILGRLARGLTESYLPISSSRKGSSFE